MKLGRAFFGESMFSRRTDASKVALAWLVARLKVGNFTLLDCQFMTEHLASLGAISIPRETYVALLSAALGGGGGRTVAECEQAQERRTVRQTSWRSTGCSNLPAPQAQPGRQDMSSRSSWARRHRPDFRRR